ncbi:hypothetical protein ACFKPU_19205, partial [Salmonella enterica subsp. enterica serovar Braenderup]
LKPHVIATRSAVGIFLKKSNNPVIASIYLHLNMLKKLRQILPHNLTKNTVSPSARARIPATPARFM